MYAKLTKRKFIRCVSYLSALCAVLFAVAAYSGITVKKYEKTLADTRLEYVLSLGEYTREMSALLKIAAFSSSDETLMKCAEDFCKNSAALSLTLSFLTRENAETTAFFSRVQECLDATYASLCEDSVCDDEQRKALLACAAYCDELSGAFSVVAQTVLTGESTLAEGRKIHKKTDSEFVCDTLVRALLTVGDMPEISNTDGAVAASGNTGSVIGNLSGVTREEAAQIAAKFCGIAPVLLRNGEDLQGAVECYRFEHGDNEICVTKCGGLIYSYISDADKGTAELDFDDAIERAGERLSELGYSDFEYIKSFVCDSTVTFTFAARSDGVVCLGDTVVLSVSLVTGRTVNLDASGYIENSRYRILPENIASESEAIAEISKAAQYVSHRLVFDEEGEACYEIVCKKDSVAARILLDAVTLDERKISLLSDA